MKMVVLTGLGNETDLRTKETSYMLVFNNGAFHVPVTEAAMQQVVGYVFGEDGQQEEPSEPQMAEPPSVGIQRPPEPNDLVDEEDGVPSL